MSTMHYRREIDGLRALAVLPVMFFHAGFAQFSGGFIGVDVFFVISGYLITSIILGDLALGRFSLSGFYARRARRILPPLFVVMLASIPLALFTMLPSQYEDFSRSLIAVTLFVSNIFFWRESDYFAADATEKPLLHTWSLGVEEQYYLLFPLFLMLAWRFGKQRTFAVLVLTAMVSLALCEFASRAAPTANFFILPTRAWELLIGAMGAMVAVHAPRAKSNLFSLAGLCMVVAAIVLYDESLRLPSLATLVPVLGTVLILLYATTGTWVARLLSCRGLVAIGLISYDAYLWHQPLFAFVRIYLLTTPTAANMAGLIGLSLVLAALTWRYVERPFRDRQHPYYVGNRRALLMACAIALLLIAMGLEGYFTHGRLEVWKKQATAQQLQAFELVEHARQETHGDDNGDCIFTSETLTDKVSARLLGCQKKYGPGIALIGDSHAMNLFFEVKQTLGDHHFVVGIAQGMCRPYSHLAVCYYDQLLTLVQQHPTLFQSIIYEQAGFNLWLDARGRIVDRVDIAGLPLDAPMPDYRVNLETIDAVVAYLMKLVPYSHVVWLGPRVPPFIRESVIVHRGCDYPFRLRPREQEMSAQLDAAIALRVQGSGINYRSQVELDRLDMAKDFMNCDVIYYTDENHYSHAGEARFGARVGLHSILNK